jgi:hypothetical protein
MLALLSRQIPVRKRKHDVQTPSHGAWAIMAILQRGLGLKKSPRRKGSNQLNSSQKAERGNRSQTLLHQLQPFDFERITAGDES